MSQFFRKEVFVRVCIIAFFVVTILISMPGCPKDGNCDGTTTACPIWPWDTNCHWDGNTSCTGCQDNSNLWSAYEGSYKTCVDEEGNPADGCSPDCVCQGCGKYKITFITHCPTTAFDDDDCEGSCTYEKSVWCEPE